MTDSKPVVREQRGGRGGKFRKRVCRLCSEGTNTIDYKRADLLIKFVSNKGKILPRRLSGSCAKHQRVISKAIRRARDAGFMPYSVQ